MFAADRAVRRSAVSLAIAAAMVVARPAAAQAPADRAGPRPGPLQASGPTGHRIAVIGFDALGMDVEKVTRLEALFRMELERLAGAKSPSRREIARALRGSKLQQCAGENACLAAIGKKLAVEMVVSGNIASLGDSYVVNIKVVNAATGAELRRIASDPLRGNPDELIDSVRVAAYRLLAPERLLGAVSVLADLDGAEVLLDGRPAGRTPLARPIGRLPLGAHRLEVRSPGYTTFAEDVQIRFQKTSRVVVRLAADPSARLGLKARPRPPGPPPAAEPWYQSTWFLVGAGVAAVVAGGYLGYTLAKDEVLDCDANPGACR